MITLTPAMVEAMLEAPDLELAMGSTAADMVASGWSYQEAMVAISVAFGSLIREERAAQRRAEEITRSAVSGIGDAIERAWRRKQATDPPEDLAEKARQREAIDARLDARRRGKPRNA